MSDEPIEDTPDVLDLLSELPTHDVDPWRREKTRQAMTSAALGRNERAGGLESTVLVLVAAAHLLWAVGEIAALLSG